MGVHSIENAATTQGDITTASPQRRGEFASTGFRHWREEIYQSSARVTLQSSFPRKHQLTSICSGYTSILRESKQNAAILITMMNASRKHNPPRSTGEMASLVNTPATPGFFI